MEPTLPPTPQPQQPNQPESPQQTQNNVISPASGSLLPQTPQVDSRPLQPDQSQLQPQSPPQTIAPAPSVIQPTSTTPTLPPDSAPVVGLGQAMPEQSQPVFFASDPAPVSAAFAPSPRSSRKKLALVFTGILAGLLLLAGAGAAAYLGIMVPNKPENVLKQAMFNSLEQNSATTKGTSEFSVANFLSGKADYETQYNIQDKAIAGKFNFTVSGINFPVEARYVNKNVYFKVGDVSALRAFIAGFGGSFGADQAQLNQALDIVSKKVANQWVVVDSTLLDQAGASCIDDLSFKLTDADKKLIQTQYEKHQFTTIKSHSSDKVNGKDAIKYELVIDGKKLDKFTNSLNDLSVVKSLEKCAKDTTDEELDTRVNAAEDSLPNSIPVTIWVDKGQKLITKTAYKLKESGSDTSTYETSAQDTIDYGQVKITAPQNAKPVIQLWGELQQEWLRVFPEDYGSTPSFSEDSISSGATLNDYITQ